MSKKYDFKDMSYDEFQEVLYSMTNEEVEALMEASDNGEIEINQEILQGLLNDLEKYGIPDLEDYMDDVTEGETIH